MRLGMWQMASIPRMAYVSAKSVSFIGGQSFYICKKQKRGDSFTDYSVIFLGRQWTCYSKPENQLLKHQAYLHMKEYGKGQ